MQTFKDTKGNRENRIFQDRGSTTVKIRENIPKKHSSKRLFSDTAPPYSSHFGESPLYRLPPVPNSPNKRDKWPQTIVSCTYKQKTENPLMSPQSDQPLISTVVKSSTLDTLIYKQHKPLFQAEHNLLFRTRYI